MTNKLALRAISMLLVIVSVFSFLPVVGTAAENSIDPFIVVSLGDSYSAGEGIDPFYGPEKELLESAENFWNRRFNDNDWLAHRSPQSWPGRLRFPGVSGNLEPHRVPDGATSTAAVQWYFVAASGAVSKEIHTNQQSRKYYQTVHDLSGDRGDKKVLSGTKYLPVQLDVFNRINGNEVDYVTLTIGGNDVQFSTIVEQAAHPKYSYSTLENTLKNLENNIGTHETNIKQAYTKINEATGGNAEIIVAGYPELFDKNGKGALISKKEATLINSKVVWFNEKLEQWVTDKKNEGMPIHFVSVIDEFDGHQAYSSSNWLNKIMINAQAEDLDEREASSYSVHPNASGAAAYARLVNAKIAEIENNKKVGTLNGKIVKASDRSTPVTSATVHVMKDSRTISFHPNSDGSYSRELPVGTHKVKVVADGYIEFNAYANIVENEIEYMETFLLIQGEEGQVGEASGTITNALNGIGIEGVQLDVRKDWNNESEGEILTTITTDASGKYIVNLPIGNYTLCASKDGFVSTTINIVVQPNMCTNKDGSMTPIVSGDNFRIVLTWGKNPSDLDSHVVGTLTNGNSFHVYYSHKSQYDGSVEVCNLDHDDTTSYGPETITLNCTNDKPYYYYIYRYSGSGTVASSGAQINVYQGETLVKTFNVPTDLGSGDCWNVFAIVDGQMVIRNTMTSRAETTYANATTFSIRAPKQNAHPAYDDRYPAKEAVAEEATAPAETIPEETTPATVPAEAVAETIPEVETQKIYLSLGQAGQDYTWKVATQDAEYDVVEEAEDIYSVELPVGTESITLRGEYEGTQISSAEIDLTNIQDNNCIVALACEEGVDEFDIMWGIYDPETQEVTFAVEENLVIAEEVPEEPAAAEEAESTEETEGEDAEVIDDAEIPENTDAVS